MAAICEQCAKPMAENDRFCGACGKPTSRLPGRPRRLVVGSGESVDVRISDPTVSNQHLAITLGSRVDRLMVEDLGSTNGTWYRGRRITKMEVSIYDNLRLAGHDCRVTDLAAAFLPERGAEALVAELGNYEMLELIGEGGMGVVYRARHRRSGEQVALKVLHTELTAQTHHTRRFRSEAKVLSELRHSGIVRFIDLIEEKSHFGLVLEWVEGQSLADFLRVYGRPLPWEEAAPLVDQLLAAVGHAHANQVVHRDIKPGNIHLTRDSAGKRQVKLLDFGIARQARNRQTVLRTVLGTLEYMAPEQHQDAASADERADVYALAVTIYEMLTHVLPWGAEELAEHEIVRRKREVPVPVPTRWCEEIPQHVSVALLGALEPNLSVRTPTVTRLHEALFNSVSSPVPSPTPVPRHDTPPEPIPPKPAPPSPIQDGRMAAGALLLGFVILLVFAAWYLTERLNEQAAVIP